MTQDPYYKALGLDPNNKNDDKKLREAYDRAHDIRKFEIEMYWRRSAYMWTLQAAALAGLALMISTSKGLSWNCNPENIYDILMPRASNCASNRLTFVAVIAVWLFGTFSSIVWILLLEGAKFWQNNWERHVDHLEHQFSGDLYKTYPGTDSIAPYSVSKLNKLMAGFVLFIWIWIAFATLGIMVPDAWCTMLLLSALSVIIFVILFVAPGVRMSSSWHSHASGKLQKEDRVFLIKRSNVKYRTPNR
jgi:hypothetical protein